MRKAVLFDIDGTLLDAWVFVFDAVKYTLDFHKQPYPSKKKIQQVLGKSLIDAYKFFAPNMDPLILAKTHHNYQDISIKQVKLFPKAKEVLGKLKKDGYSLGVVSNRTKKSLHYSLKLAEIDHYFDTIVSGEDVKNIKPHKEHILYALKHLQVEVENAHMVGDTKADILAGKNAGVKTIGVTFGFDKNIKKFKPDYLIDDLEQLMEILK